MTTHITLSAVYPGSARKFLDQRSCPLLQRVEDQSEGARAVSLIEQLLQKQNAVGAMMRLSGRRHEANTVLVQHISSRIGTASVAGPPLIVVPITLNFGR
jgi:hypothetical protein